MKWQGFDRIQPHIDRDAMPPTRRYNRVSNEDRNRIIQRHEAGEDYLEMATQLGVPRTTAYQIVRT